MLGAVHLWAATAALISGAVVVLRPKGVGPHKWIGRIYLVAMVLTLGTAFSIYELFGGFGAFHIAATVSTVTIVAGIMPAWRRKPRTAGSGVSWIGDREPSASRPSSARPRFAS